MYHPCGLTFKNIYIFSKTLHQPKYVELQKVLSGIKEIGLYTYSDLAEVPSPDAVEPYSIFIIDDIVGEPGVNDIIRKFYSWGRHRNIDIFLLSQTYSNIGKHNIRDNCNFLLVFRQDALNLKHISDDHVAPDVKFDQFLEICKVAWESEPHSHGCLLVSTESPTNNGKFRCGIDRYIIL